MQYFTYSDSNTTVNTNNMFNTLNIHNSVSIWKDGNKEVLVRNKICTALLQQRTTDVEIQYFLVSPY